MGLKHVYGFKRRIFIEGFQQTVLKITGILGQWRDDVRVVSVTLDIFPLVR